MKTANWSKVAAIFDSVVDLDENERKSYLARACGDDEVLRSDVEAMVAADREASGLFSGPILGQRIPIGTEFEPSERIGPYEIVRLIGRGGMGAVYLARRVEDFDRLVAIKVIDRLVPDKATLRRFLRERQILSTLDHPNIARLFDGGVTESGMPYLVMEYVDGVPIDVYCRRETLTLEERLQIFLDVCRAVAHAHRHLIVHRDLKPGNILVSDSGGVKLLDFGVANRVDLNAPDWQSTEYSAFTPGYASPEQINGGVVTTSSDVYSLGVILSKLTADLELGTGGVLEYPDGIGRTSPVRSLVKRLLSLSRPALLRADLLYVKERATHKDPDQRHTSIDELLKDIVDILSINSLHYFRTSVAHRGSHFLVRNRRSVTVAILSFSLLVVSILVGLDQRNRALRMDAASASLTRYLSEVIAISDPEERVDSSITAKQFLDVGLTHARTWLDSNSESYRRVATQLGRLYLKIGEARLSEEVFRDLLDRTGGRNQPNSLLGYGMALHELGKHDAAERYYELAYQLAAARQHDAIDLLPDIFEGMILLAIDLNQLSRADSLVDACLGNRDLEASLSPEERAEILALKAQIMTRHDSLGRAEQLYTQVLQMQQRSLGTNSIQSAVTMNNLGMIYTGTGRYRLANQILKRALQIKRSRLGSEHPSVGMTLLNLAEAKKHTSGLDSAITTLNDALGILSKKLGPNNATVAQARNNLAILLEEKGEYELAEELYRQAVSTWERALPMDHPMLIRGWHNLAILLRQSSRAEESLIYYAKAVKGYRSQGEHHRKDLGDVLVGQAKAQRLVGDLVGAASSFRESLAIREEVYPPGHWRIGTAESLLGETLALLGERDEAERLLRSGLEILRTSRGPDDVKTLEAEGRLKTLKRDMFVHASIDGQAL